MSFPSRPLALALASAVALGLSACSAPTGDDDAGPAPTETTAAPVDGCAVSGPGGFDDAGLGQQMIAGFTMAKNDDRLGGTQSLRSPSTAGFEEALRSMLGSGCSVIAAPAQAGAQVRDLARDNPDQPFVLVGGGAEGLPENVATLGFDQRGPAFLSGYAAAALSESGTVATVGGVRDRGTVRAMDAFAAGVEQYNADQEEPAGEGGETATPEETEGDDARQVRLLGWDRDSRTGEFARDRAGVQRATRDAVADGADVVFPVAGDANAGVVAAVLEAKEELAAAEEPEEELEALGDLRLVWTGANGRSQLPDGVRGNVLAGVVLHTDEGYGAVLSDWANGTPRTPVRIATREWTGDLENEGVTFLAPSETELLTSGGLDGRLEELTTALLEGEIELG